ncbi:MAG: hypothetical protein HLX46_00370 [Corynebacterium sp.]|uniref:hypothetical protein n=1 Tax=Corynebacterium sp. TaxID=1720 RepID=UPI001842CFBB|nr:hypothetical protein [Corynebacterium sp.]NWO15312.1 hypothetical protein [Corynebacterium sp.]
MALRIKLIKRIFLALLLLTVGTMLILRGLGLVSNSAVLIAFLAVELPTLLIVLTLTGFELYQLKKTRGLRGQEFLTAIEEEQPLLRFAILEARTLFALIEVLLGRKHGVVSSTLGFSYAKGTLAIPIALGIVTVIEAAAIHVLIPWAWLRIILLVASLYALILISGIFAARAVNPHLVSPQSLTLKWGHRIVLQTPRSNIAKVQLLSNHQYIEPTVDGSLMVLTSFTSTNVRITLDEPIPAHPPVPKKKLLPGFAATEVDIYVANAQDFIRSLETATQQ